MRVDVSKHAIERLKERFYFYFPISCFYSAEDTKSFIRGQLKSARKLSEWKMCPFYANMIGWKHGPNTEVYYKAPVYYIVDQSPGRFMVVTVTKNFKCGN